MATVNAQGQVNDRSQVTAAPRTRFSTLLITGSTRRRVALSSRMAHTGAGSVMEAATVADARDLASSAGVQGHDICILDGTTADEPVIPLMAHLRTSGWRRITLLGGRTDAPAIRAAISNGARSYLVVTPENEATTPAPVARIRERSVRHDELSAREIEVIQLVAEGQSNKEIGEALSLSALTVKSHLARIARKLGTGDRAEMVALACRGGIIQ